MISLTELRAMLKENKIRGYLHYNKSELLDVLVRRVLLPDTINITTITSLPEREVIIYSSMYKAAKRFNQQSRLISAYDAKVWKSRYAIKVLTESECF